MWYGRPLKPQISLRMQSDQSKKEGKDQESIQSSTTPDPGYQWESDDVTIRHHNESQGVSPFPAGDNKASTDVHESITKQDRTNINDPLKKLRLGTVSKNILLEGLNRFNGAPTSPLVQMWIKTNRCLVCMKDPNLSMHHLLEQDVKKR